MNTLTAIRNLGWGRQKKLRVESVVEGKGEAGR